MTTHGAAAKGMRLQLERLRERQERDDENVRSLMRDLKAQVQRAEKAEAEVEQLRAALEKMISYAEQLELAAMPNEWMTDSQQVLVARAALRGGE